MTDGVDETKIANKAIEEEETTELDMEENESAYTDDESSVTTDDEFYGELMDVPPEHEDHLIPDGCTDEIVGIDSLTSCLNRRYNSCPVVYTGALKDALNGAFDAKEIKERRPLLIYVNHDKSLYSNLFCRQLLCNDTIIDFLLNNYVLWAWDVTFPSNGEKLNELYNATFPKDNLNQKLGTYSIEQYPLLIGCRRDRNGNCVFFRFIEGSNKIPDVDEFIARLMQFKDQFDLGEEEFEKEKINKEKYLFDSPMRTYDWNSRSTDLRDDNFLTTMLSPMRSNVNPSLRMRFSRNHDGNPLLFNRHMPFFNTFGQMNINPNDSDQDDDADEQTPTVDRPSPQYPK